MRSLGQGADVVLPLREGHEDMEMSQKIELQTENEKRFLVVGDIPAEEACRYMHVGDRIPSPLPGWPGLVVESREWSHDILGGEVATLKITLADDFPA